MWLNVRATRCSKGFKHKPPLFFLSLQTLLKVILPISASNGLHRGSPIFGSCTSSTGWGSLLGCQCVLLKFSAMQMQDIITFTDTGWGVRARTTFENGWLQGQNADNLVQIIFWDWFEESILYLPLKFSTIRVLEWLSQLSVGLLLLAQVKIPGSWDRALSQALCWAWSLLEMLSFSPSVSPPAYTLSFSLKIKII